MSRSTPWIKSPDSPDASITVAENTRSEKNTATMQVSTPRCTAMSAEISAAVTDPGLPRNVGYTHGVCAVNRYNVHPESIMIVNFGFRVVWSSAGGQN